MLNLDVKKIIIVGMNGSGKTELVKHLCRNQPQHMIYDYHHEYNGFNRYIVAKKNSYEERVAELTGFVQYHLKKNPTRLFVIDELNQFCLPKPATLPEPLLDISDNHRHWYNENGISFIGVTRRMSQLHTDLIELAHYRIFFRLQGKNDLQYLENLKKGLSNVVVNLQPFQFAILDMQGNVEVHNPIPM